MYLFNKYLLSPLCFSPWRATVNKTTWFPPSHQEQRWA